MRADFCKVTPKEFGKAPQQREWIWEGYLAPRKLTLFTSVCKSGKTTLLAHLLSQRRGGGDLAGKRVAPGLSVIVSEEEEAMWQERHACLNLRDDDSYLFRPFGGVPTENDWVALIDFLMELAQAGAMNLVVLDPLGVFLPAGAENYAPWMMAALHRLTALAKIGVAVLLIHHPCKARAPEGLAARGCNALSGFVDIVMEMRYLNDQQRGDRRRRLVAFGRDRITPCSQIIELSADGLTYACRDEPLPPDDFLDNWKVLRIIFEDAKHELTHLEIQTAWPTDFPGPRRAMLYEWLNKAHERGLVQRDGTGHCKDPYRYYLPEKMIQWQSDPLWQLTEKMREAQKQVAELLG